VNEIFTDHVIVMDWREKSLRSDEYWKVTYTRDGENIVFAARDAWEIVELTYQPQTVPPPSPSPMGESKKGKGKRFAESIVQSVEFVESEGQNDGGPWLIKGIGITADVINANGRRYPAAVLEAAVRKLKNHLHESAGQGRLLQENVSLTTGESDHPKDKGNRRPLLLETVVNWENVAFDGTQVLLEGKLLATSNGKDIRAIMAGGVKPGISQRAYGESKVVKEGKLKIEEVTDLEITGFDLTAPNEESDPNAEVTFHESKTQQGEYEMEELLKQLMELRKAHPELFGSMTEAQMKALGEEQLKALEESLRSKLGIGPSADIAKALDESINKARQFDELQRKNDVTAAITEATKNLPFGKKLNEAFVAALNEADLKSADEVKTFAEAKRKEYGRLASGNALAGMGFSGMPNLQVTGTVLENQTGTPEFARGAFELAESIRRVESKPTRDWNKQGNINEQYAKRVLDRFDAFYQRELKLEARLIEEAGTVSDLNLPYSVARAIIEEAFPDLIATGIFDFDTIDTNPTRLYFELFSGETGYSVDITDEVLVADHGAWVALANQRLTPGSVVVTNSAGTTTYVEDTHYLVDYANGRIYALASGTITDGQSLKVDYTYTAIRKGEMAAIERGKITLSYINVEAKADRLADQISRESILFAQSQMGFDVRARTLANLAKQMRRKIDEGMMYMALSAAKTVANNVVGTWTAATDTELAFVKLVGLARVKVAKRYYEPTFSLFSTANADKIANWDGFTAAGKRPDADLNANGYIGRIKGLAAFQGTEFTDGYSLVGNKQLVMHRIFKPISFQGPLPTFDSNGKIIAAEQYYAEEFNLTEAPVPGKGSLVKIA
jgi:hypothetical protein